MSKDTTIERVAVTQADRDAAADLLRAACASLKNVDVDLAAREMSSGKDDGSLEVQSFARHRISASSGMIPREPTAEMIEAGREAWITSPGSDFGAAWRAMHDAALNRHRDPRGGEDV